MQMIDPFLIQRFYKEAVVICWNFAGDLKYVQKQDHFPDAGVYVPAEPQGIFALSMMIPPPQVPLRARSA